LFPILAVEIGREVAASAGRATYLPKGVSAIDKQDAAFADPAARYALFKAKVVGTLRVP
jgi:uncharacterized protein (UPF0261 family)